MDRNRALARLIRAPGNIIKPVASIDRAPVISNEAAGSLAGALLVSAGRFMNTARGPGDSLEVRVSRWHGWGIPWSPEQVDWKAGGFPGALSKSVAWLGDSLEVWSNALGCLPICLEGWGFPQGSRAFARRPGQHTRRFKRIGRALHEYTRRLDEHSGRSGGFPAALLQRPGGSAARR